MTTSGRGQHLADRSPRSLVSRARACRSRRPLSQQDLTPLRGKLDFTEDELAAIDGYAVDSGIDLWAASSHV